MKKYMLNRLKYILLSFLSVFSMNSCNDIIDLSPKDLLSADLALQSLDDYQSALLGAYATLRSAAYYGQDFMLTPDIISDNLKITSQSQGRLVQEHRWTFTSGSTLASGIWITCYSTIYRSNNIISRIDGQAGDQTRKDLIKGQAYALRGLAHFDLLRWFGESYDPNFTGNQSGIPIKLDQALTFPSRNTVAEVYQRVFSDLEDARALLTGKTNYGIAEPHYIDVTAVNGFLARVSLYAGRYNDAATYATQVINAKPLSPRATFANIWTPEEAIGEVLFSVPYTVGGWPSVVWSPNFDVYEFVPSNDLVNLYDRDNDIRWSSYFRFFPNRVPSEVAVGKYTGPATQPGLADVKALRTGEMYLIRAEARALGNIDGGLAGANSDINTLRAARITGYSDQDYAANEILEQIDIERRKELAFEGHRWFDIKRRGEAVVRGSDYGPASFNFVLPAGNFRFIMPIPAGEMLANPNIKQNDGYGG
jgi:starch-binding outer membrane protein, SusD/RagB family